MFETINPIQNQNIFKVNPVKLDEQNRFEQNNQNLFQNQAQSEFSPNHPDMKTSFRANHLDFMA